MEFLSRKGVEYTSKDITKDPDAIQELVAAGANSTPTIRVGEEWLIGFRQAKLEELLAD